MGGREEIFVFNGSWYAHKLSFHSSKARLCYVGRHRENNTICSLGFRDETSLVKYGNWKNDQAYKGG